MNKRIFKRIMSLVLIVVMAVSTMMVSAVSTSAETENVTYKFDIQTAGSDGTSKDAISIKVNGENNSTSWHNVGKVAKDKKGSCSFSDINVGAIKSITVKNDDDNGWYPEIINITVGETTTTIYGGRWVDDKKEVTLSVTDRVAKINVQTSAWQGIAGTDNNVYIRLIDEKGNIVGDKNLTEIHPKVNAFERYDRATFYIHIPDNFGELKEISVIIDHSISMEEWDLDYIDVTLDGETKLFPCYDEVSTQFKTLKPLGYLYKVTVKTSDELFAGTDNQVNLFVLDEKGDPIDFDGQQEDANYYYLGNEDNNFEMNSTDVFYIVSPKKVANIIIVNYNEFALDDWHLDYVQLDLMDGDNVVESTKYNFKQWIRAFGAMRNLGSRIYNPQSIENATDFVEYKVDFQTAGNDGTSIDDISIKVNGENGSTSWHDVNKVANDIKGSCTFSDINVGTIKSISVQNSSSDGWYPEIINITLGGKTTTIYGGRWVDDRRECILFVTDKVAKVTVKTGNVLYSGTDNNVCISFVDKIGRATEEVKLSDIHPDLNAFERYDRTTFYVHIPKDFGELTKTDVHLNSGSDDWYLDYIDVTLDGETKLFPCYAFVDDKIKTLNTTGYLYKVTVKTSSKSLAGTDNDVYLHAYDENGNKIKDFFLDNDKNNFEKGDKEYFYIASPQKINDIKMNISSSGGTDWHLEYVQLDLMNGNKAVESKKYNYNKWIEGGKKLYEPTS